MHVYFQVGLTDGDLMAILQQVLMPVAFEVLYVSCWN